MNTLNWFEIPCQDLDRAVRFYEAVTGKQLKRESFFGTPHGIFPRDGEASVTGALIQNQLRPSVDGTVIYLDAAGHLDAWLARVADAGGRVLLPRTSIGEMGAIAQLQDTEGNRIGLHQRA